MRKINFEKLTNIFCSLGAIVMLIGFYCQHILWIWLIALGFMFLGLIASLIDEYLFATDTSLDSICNR